MSEIKNIYIVSLAGLILTIIHHAYGAYIYEAPFRLHVVLIMVPVGLFLWVTLTMTKKYAHTWPGKTARWLFLSVVIIVPLSLIGLFEGGYNHFLKNILFFSGIPEELFARLFPPPAYERPNDIFFEVTGTGQFVTGLMIIPILTRYIRFLKREK